MTGRLHREGRRLPHRWLLDANGVATDDPSVFFAEPKGSILPLGGIEQGYKGFSLGLLIEAMTSGLSGYGRAYPQDGWGASVLLQMFWPDAFGGAGAFAAEMDHTSALARNNRPALVGEPVRLPGDRASARRTEQLADGIELHASMLPALRNAARKYNIALPSPLTGGTGANT